MPPDLSAVRRFLAELHRRRVYRVAAVYAGVSFIVIQAADLVFPALALPVWTYRFLVVLVLLGFPIAVALAWAFDITPTGVERTAPAPTAGGARSRRPRRLLWAVAVVGVLAAGVWYVLRQTDAADAAALDRDLVAVLPFRVTDADGSALYLGEGMVDLLAAKFTGTGGPRAIDPQRALSAARRAGQPHALDRDALLRLGRSLGARLVTTGSVVATPAGLAVQATLLDAATGRELASVSQQGRPDELPALVDRLAAALLSLSAGEAEQRLPSLTSASLPALRAYLEGQAEMRRGRFEAAAQHFAHAVDQDSTFTHAVLGHAMALQWNNAPDWLDVLHVAWEQRDRLSARDRVLLEAYGGPNFPAASTMAEWIGAAERAARTLPDRVEAWYWLADRLFHQGDWVGWPDAQVQARRHFEHAVALDSTFLQPVIHLLEIAAAERDTAAVRRYAALYFAADSVSWAAEAFRWLVAVSLGDSAALRALRGSLATTSATGLRTALHYSLQPNGPLADADAIAAELARRADTRSERVANVTALYRYAQSRGRPEAATAHLAELQRLTGRDIADAEIRNALYWDGDRGAAGRALRDLERRLASDAAADMDTRAVAACHLAQWRLWHDELEAGERHARVLATLRPQLEGERAPLEQMDACSRVVDAVARVQRRDAGARAAVRALDDYFSAGRMDAYFRARVLDSGLTREAPIILARLWEALGEPDHALTAMRRRWLATSEFHPAVLAHEARLAAAAGERDAARRLYGQYLLLMSDAEPSMRAQVERVRGELAALRAPD